MIVDLILDRKDGEAWGLEYSAHDFYYNAMQYGRIADNITRAMDGGTNDDVRRALCEYIDRQDYNPAIKDYINAREWVTD